MATYYVRMSGSDSNTGTSPAQAWRTLTKALGTTGLNSGDTLFVGSGTYRETVTVTMVSPTSETKIIGDTSGTYTGDAGEIIWSAYLNGDYASPSGNPCLTLNIRRYLTFEGITFLGGTAAGPCVYNAASGVGTCQNITFRNCSFLAPIHPSNNNINLLTNFNEPLNLLIEGCRFFGRAGIWIVALGSSTGAHFNMNIVVRNCYFATMAGGVSFDSSGTFNGNGAEVSHCWFHVGNGNAVRANQATQNTVYPTVVKNCFGFVWGSPLWALTVGQIIDAGGNRFSSASGYASVTQHATSRIGYFPNVLPIEIGQSYPLGLPYRHPLVQYNTTQTVAGGVFGFGNISPTTTADMLGTPRPSGSSVLYDSGTASSATASTLVDTTKNWPTAALTGWLVSILTGTGAGQIKRIRTNTSNSLSITGGAPAGGNWAVTPDNTSSYVIYQGPQVETGRATGGTTTTLIDSNANWETNMWNGFSCVYDGITATVTSNTATTLTFTTTQASAPTTASTYSLYFPGSSLTAVLPAAGAFEGSGTGRLDTTTYAT